MCGVVGVYKSPKEQDNAAYIAYEAMLLLQHRGQESAGIAVWQNNSITVHKQLGKVNDIFTSNTLRELNASLAIGHIRYSTSGDKCSLPNAQPFCCDSRFGKISLAHNGNLTNTEELRQELEHAGVQLECSSDSELILKLIAAAPGDLSFPDAIRFALRKIRGAFSLVIMGQGALIAARDPRGFRPLVLGEKAGESGTSVSYIVASETNALDIIGATYINELSPGQLMLINARGRSVRLFADPIGKSQCVFEHVYFSRPDSIVFGRPVSRSRELMGSLLAQTDSVPADIVVPVPNSGINAALGYAMERKLPYQMGLIRNHYIGRTFIEPDRQARGESVRRKLNPDRHVLNGKRIILVDDSLVRGNTCRKLVRMIRRAGATEVHVRICCPPTTHPCFYGVDTPDKDELMAANNSVDEICRFIEADSLIFLPLDRLRQAAGDTGLKPEYCYACYNGEYPTDVSHLVTLMPG